MDKNVGILVAITAIVGVGTIVFLDSSSTENNAVETNLADSIVIDTTNEVAESLDSDVVSSGGVYQDYSLDKLALAETGDVVIFFQASWCPSCRALDKDINDNVGDLPQGVAILKADFDTETELKTKYGVTTQHTLVQVDQNGNMINKWSGGSTLESVISRI